MHYELNEHTVRITCTFGELVAMDSNGWSVYAKPANANDRLAVNLYVDDHHRYLYDFRIATVQDFCEAEGWESLGWEDLDTDELAHVAADEITIEVPRNKSSDQRRLE